MKTITTLILAFVASACIAQSNKGLTNKQKEPEALPGDTSKKTIKPIKQ